MDNILREDTRKLLKAFGVQADEAILAHLIRTQRTEPLKIRLVLQDLTDYGTEPPAEPLHLEIEGTIRPR
jgi:hypothetical protein